MIGKMIDLLFDGCAGKVGTFQCAPHTCLPACLPDLMCMQSAVMSNLAELDQLTNGRATWRHETVTTSLSFPQPCAERPHIRSTPDFRRELCLWYSKLKSCLYPPAISANLGNISCFEMTTTRPAELASTIAVNTAKIDAYLASNGTDPLSVERKRFRECTVWSRPRSSEAGGARSYRRAPCPHARTLLVS